MNLIKLWWAAFVLVVGLIAYSAVSWHQQNRTSYTEVVNGNIITIIAPRGTRLIPSKNVSVNSGVVGTLVVPGRDPEPLASSAVPFQPLENPYVYVLEYEDSPGKEQAAMSTAAQPMFHNPLYSQVLFQPVRK